jgi:hypothetical protein
MRRSTILAASFAILSMVGGATHFTVARTDEGLRDYEFREMITRSRSEHPQRGLGYDWYDCQERYWPEENKTADRVVCESWTQQGVTITLIALKFGAEWVPVVESRLADAADGGPIVLDIQGGPGGEPLHVSEGMSDEFIARLRRNGLNDWLPGDIRQSPYNQLFERGYTVASIGYWGMNLKTLNLSDEFDLAIRDVRMAVDYYRDNRGADLPLIAVSLGNHLALAALGSERIEGMSVLALVPVMDGLQHHLTTSLAREKAKADQAGHLFGTWTFFNVYRKSDDSVQFDHSRMLPMHEFIPRYVGDADFPWKEVTPSGPCAKVVLGAKDPRTLAFLAESDDLPDFVRVLEADHNLFEDAPDEARTLFAEFADCIASQQL